MLVSFSSPPATCIPISFCQQLVHHMMLLLARSATLCCLCMFLSFFFSLSVSLLIYASNVFVFIWHTCFFVMVIFSFFFFLLFVRPISICFSTSTHCSVLNGFLCFVDPFEYTKIVTIYFIEIEEKRRYFFLEDFE